MVSVTGDDQYRGKFGDSIPYTGVPLPLISFGGSSLVVSLAAVGVLLNISRYIQEPEMPCSRGGR